MDALWMTDPHLNFLAGARASKALGEYLCQEQSFDAVILSGDIAEAPSLCELLSAFAQGVAPRPVYFVLGNHDYYRGSFISVQQAMRTGIEEPNLVWLDEAEVTLLDENTALVGHQGWFDARLGNATKSRVVMNDFSAIEELREHYLSELNWVHGGRAALIAKLHEIGDAAACEAKAKLQEALRARSTAIFVTHFPPFKEACWHEGAISDDHWLPWFTCQAMGSALLETAHQHPDKRILVLCGHTHSPGQYDPAPNLRVLTGKAVYGAPDVSMVLRLPLPEWTAEPQGPTSPT